MNQINFRRLSVIQKYPISCRNIKIESFVRKSRARADGADDEQANNGTVFMVEDGKSSKKNLTGYRKIKM